MSESVSSAASREADQVFDRVAEVFGLLSSPMRLRIVSELCPGELCVSQLSERLGIPQPNVSQHLAMLYRAGAVIRRREGAQVFYRIGGTKLSAICRSICDSFELPSLAR
jgi:DNA-binding transcriptional ArsR family regulator